MKNITEHLAQYACYHRDRRNIATHLVGIPLIVLGIVILLSRPQFMLFGLSLSPAYLVALFAAVYYVRLDTALGVLMAVLLAICLWVGEGAALLQTTSWLGLGIGLFVLGWAFQFIGHYFEGRKPAFVDDITGLVIGPLFVVTEVVFMLGLRKSLKAQVESRVAELMPPGN
ncbi:hypothetical protein CWE09_09600 [Aliidiomarina minuta]|uniref:DUF962 domain-containing protein n=1 Tax=Aliidiomarina minuta TaxID=880057 RepID=A0A432W9Y5_9GAMM|nr:Mpo1-like protein [Aliidiomarina minuta]RUO26924.1 hypothetical protein CWE09_09600 [Aliidiomarina minuta]